ncbi:MAG: hypothetical protein ABSA57_20430 [Candidatus Acidiferrales bacterium]|jgi:hypothetical protein
MLITINGAVATFIAKVRPDGDSWDLRCVDPLVGEFRLRPGDALHYWSNRSGEWLPASEMDLIELAVAELEKGKGTSTGEEADRDANRFCACGKAIGKTGSRLRRGGKNLSETGGPALRQARGGVPTHVSG